MGTKTSATTTSLFSDSQENLATWYMLAMPIEDRISQLIISGIDGSENLNSSLGNLPAPGAFLFFAYNIADTPAKVMGFTTELHQYYTNDRKTVPPLIFLDHEGGQVNRLRKVASPLPTAEKLPSTLDAVKAEELYYYAGKQMKALGFHVNLAPIVESYNDKNRIFLDSRSYGTPFQVQEYAHAAMRGYKQANMAVTVKHFPGNTDDDPHFSLPILSAEKVELYSQYIYPFRISLFENPDAILLSHVITPAIDPVYPACLSYKTVTNILRKDFSYEGLIVSDDLYMGALSDSGFKPEDAVIKAVDAGVTMIMLSAKNTFTAREALLQKALKDSAFLYKINLAVAKIITFKIKQGLLNINEGLVTPAKLHSEEQRKNDFSAAYADGLQLYNDNF